MQKKNIALYPYFSDAVRNLCEGDKLLLLPLM